MKGIIKRAALLALCTLLLMGMAFPAFAAGNSFSTDVYLQSGVKITQVSLDVVIPAGGNTTLAVVAEGGGLTYLWAVSRDGGASWSDASGTNDEQQYSIINAKSNTPAETPYLYRITVTDHLGQSASEIVRVLVHNDYEYTTRTDSENGVAVTGFLHNTAQLVVEVIQTETTASELQSMIREGNAPLAAYEVYLRTSSGITLPAYIGRMELSFAVDDVYDGDTLNVYHKKSSGAIETLSGTVSGAGLTITTDALSPFLIEVPAATVNAVTVTSGPNGDVSPTGTVYVPNGADKTFVFTPHTGYVLDTVTVDGIAVSVIGNSYTLKNVQRGHTLHTTFEKPSLPPEGSGNSDPTTYTVTILATANGHTSPTGKVTVEHGDSLIIYFYPNEGYVLDKVLLDGTKVSTGINSHTFTVTKSVTVAVSFKAKTVTPPVVTRTITATAGNHGKVSPGGTTTVNDGGDLYVYFIPDNGYEVNTVTVDGEAVDAGTSWHFINLRTDHVIHVTFKAKSVIFPGGGTTHPDTTDPGGTPEPGNQPNSGETDPGATKPGANSELTYATITIHVDGENGSISPKGVIIAEIGGSQTIYFYPDEGYEVDTVLINGKKVDGNFDCYTVESIQGDMEIVVTFKPVDSSETSCACVVCGFWSAIFPGSGCVCPWCWLIPLLIVLIVITLIIRRWLQKKQQKSKKRTVEPLAK